MQPNKPQNQNNIPNHVPISQLKDQLVNKDKSPVSTQGAPINNNQPVIIAPNLDNQNIETSSQNNINNNSSDTIMTNSQNNQPNIINASQQSGKPNKQYKGPVKLLVFIQFVCLLVIIFGFYPSPLFSIFSLMIGGVLMVALGMFLGIWSFISFHQKINISPVPLKHSFLVTEGPFKYIRHPMYATLILISVGLILVYPSLIRILAVVILLIVLNIKMNIEENLLAERYHHYGRYQRLTGRILPKLHKPKIDIDIDVPKF